jgi:flagellar basal-body rod protein FlgF
MGEGWHSECYEDESMVEGIYNNAASLSVLEKWQATISQNLASSNVAGFKKANFAIQSDERKKTEYEPDGVSAARHTGGVPTRTTSINFSPGDLKATGKNTDLAIEGPGFFQVQGADGENLYTRDGEFQINADNTVVTKHGLPVLADGAPITVDPDQGALVVARDGTISQGDNQLGRLSLYNFDDPKGLVRVEGGFFEPQGGNDPQLMEEIAITQGAIESSNVLPMAELVSLIAVSRAYEASQRAMTSHDDLISKAINSLGTTNA